MASARGHRICQVDCAVTVWVEMPSSLGCLQARLRRIMYKIAYDDWVIWRIVEDMTHSGSTKRKNHLKSVSVSGVTAKARRTRRG